MLKILLFSYKFDPDVGGIESISKMLAAYFSEAGHEVHLLTKTTSATICQFPFKVIRDPGLFTIIKELKWADIVFENNPCFSISYPNFFIRKPSVISLQTWLETLSGKYDTRQKFKHALLRSASAVVACSEAIRVTFPEAIVIPNPYDDTVFKIKPGVQRTRDFIFLGRLVSDKGADIAIKGLHALLKKYPCTNLTVVGNGEEITVLKKLVQDAGLQWSVRFTGILQHDELVDCLNEHRFIIVPSVWKEPFGIVALEGLACGCIPIVSDGGGLLEAAGNAGLVFKRGNLEGLVQCMQEALQNLPGSKELSPEIHHHLQTHTVSAIAGRYLQVFASILKQVGKDHH